MLIGIPIRIKDGKNKIYIHCFVLYMLRSSYAM